jgi:hypothetical protein
MQLETQSAHTNITIRRPNPDRYMLKKRRGIQKMIIVGSRVLAKVGNLIPNPHRFNFRQIRERVFNNVANSVGDNRYKIKFDDSTTKEVHSNSLQIEDSSSGIPLSEVIATVVEATDDNGTQQASKVNTNPDIEETKDFTFLIDSTSIDDIIDNTNKEDDSINNEVEINIGDINVPADAPDSNNNSTDTNTTLLIHHQKLEN